MILPFHDPSGKPISVGLAHRTASALAVFCLNQIVTEAAALRARRAEAEVIAAAAADAEAAAAAAAAAVVRSAASAWAAAARRVLRLVESTVIAAAVAAAHRLSAGADDVGDGVDAVVPAGCPILSLAGTAYAVDEDEGEHEADREKEEDGLTSAADEQGNCTAAESAQPSSADIFSVSSSSADLDTLPLSLGFPSPSSIFPYLGVAVRLVPLYSYGTVAARARFYLSDVLTLPRHAAALRAADVVLTAAHSQGSVVASHVLTALVDDGTLDPASQLLGVVTLAGTHHGPYPDTGSDGLPATRELFRLGHPSSAAARAHAANVDALLRRGVRVAALGAWFDAVVPLHSAALGLVRPHPGLLRGLVVDPAHHSKLAPLPPAVAARVLAPAGDESVAGIAAAAVAVASAVGALSPASERAHPRPLAWSPFTPLQHLSLSLLLQLNTLPAPRRALAAVAAAKHYLSSLAAALARMQTARAAAADCLTALATGATPAPADLRAANAAISKVSRDIAAVIGPLRRAGVPAPLPEPAGPVADAAARLVAALSAAGLPGVCAAAVAAGELDDGAAESVRRAHLASALLQRISALERGSVLTSITHINVKEGHATPPFPLLTGDASDTPAGAAADAAAAVGDASATGRPALAHPAAAPLDISSAAHSHLFAAGAAEDAFSVGVEWCMSGWVLPPLARARPRAPVAAPTSDADAAVCVRSVSDLVALYAQRAHSKRLAALAAAAAAATATGSADAGSAAAAAPRGPVALAVAPAPGAGSAAAGRGALHATVTVIADLDGDRLLLERALWGDLTGFAAVLSRLRDVAAMLVALPAAELAAADAAGARGLSDEIAHFSAQLASLHGSIAWLYPSPDSATLAAATAAAEAAGAPALAARAHPPWRSELPTRPLTVVLAAALAPQIDVPLRAQLPEAYSSDALATPATVTASAVNAAALVPARLDYEAGLADVQGLPSWDPARLAFATEGAHRPLPSPAHCRAYAATCGGSGTTAAVLLPAQVAAVFESFLKPAGASADAASAAAAAAAAAALHPALAAAAPWPAFARLRPTAPYLGAPRSRAPPPPAAASVGIAVIGAPRGAVILPPLAPTPAPSPAAGSPGQASWGTAQQLLWLVPEAARRLLTATVADPAPTVALAPPSSPPLLPLTGDGGGDEEDSVASTADGGPITRAPGVASPWTVALDDSSSSSSSSFGGGSHAEDDDSDSGMAVRLDFPQTSPFAAALAAVSAAGAGTGASPSTALAWAVLSRAAAAAAQIAAVHAAPSLAPAASPAQLLPLLLLLQGAPQSRHSAALVSGAAEAAAAAAGPAAAAASAAAFACAETGSAAKEGLLSLLHAATAVDASAAAAALSISALSALTQSQTPALPGATAPASTPATAGASIQPRAVSSSSSSSSSGTSSGAGGVGARVSARLAADVLLGAAPLAALTAAVTAAAAGAAASASDAAAAAASAAAAATTAANQQQQQQQQQQQVPAASTPIPAAVTAPGAVSAAASVSAPALSAGLRAAVDAVVAGLARATDDADADALHSRAHARVRARSHPHKPAPRGVDPDFEPHPLLPLLPAFARVMVDPLPLPGLLPPRLPAVRLLLMPAGTQADAAAAAAARRSQAGARTSGALAGSVAGDDDDDEDAAFVRSLAAVAAARDGAGSGSGSGSGARAGAPGAAGDADGERRWLPLTQRSIPGHALDLSSRDARSYGLVPESASRPAVAQVAAPEFELELGRPSVPGTSPAERTRHVHTPAGVSETGESSLLGRLRGWLAQATSLASGSSSSASANHGHTAESPPSCIGDFESVHFVVVPSVLAPPAHAHTANVPLARGPRVRAPAPLLHAPTDHRDGSSTRPERREEPLSAERALERKASVRVPEAGCDHSDIATEDDCREAAHAHAGCTVYRCLQCGKVEHVSGADQGAPVGSSEAAKDGRAEPFDVEKAYAQLLGEAAQARPAQQTH
jgi:hypothetical protein